jgi:hypothetical protein
VRLIPTSPLSSEFSSTSNLSERMAVSIGRHGSRFVLATSLSLGGTFGDRPPCHLVGVRPPRVLEEVP